MSRDAVSLSVPELLCWTERECLDFMVKVRFQSWNTVSCPHCGTIGKHYWRPREKRWKCMGCGSTFSVTSKTVFANHKKSLREILTGALMWLNSAAGQPALELKRHLNTTYNTAFTLQTKLREALVRGHNVGLLNGDIEVDGAHQSGWRADEKRGVPQGGRRKELEDADEKPDETQLTQQGRQEKKKKQKKTGAYDPEFGRKLPENRRILMTVRKRSEQKGKGACATRIAIGLTETHPVVEAMFKNFVATPESFLNTDSSPAYTELGKQFRAHRTVEHSLALSGPNGENNNQAEELNWRYDRAEKGTYLNIEPKYMHDYAVEIAFRSDTRRLPNGQQLERAMHYALSVGLSEYWIGFTHGNHRHEEWLLPRRQPAPSSGPAKGRNPFSNASGRPPR